MADTPVLVSACLLGMRTRYDGTGKLNRELVEQLKGRRVIPVCPEQLGGLPTPRHASYLCEGAGEAVLAGNGRVVNTAGVDVTRQFICGAYETLHIAQLLGAQEAFMKTRSPSCGKEETYIEQELRSGNGVCIALLLQHGIKVNQVD